LISRACCGVWLRRWRRRLNKWRRSWLRTRRVGAKRRAEELSAIRDILYEE
jgi:hypothetical protein